MLLRRSPCIRIFVLALALGSASLLAPDRAMAQRAFTTIGPGGVLAYSTASLTVANRTDEVTLWSYSVPAPYVATFTNGNAAGTTINDPPTADGTLPLHLKISGSISTAAAGGPLSIGVNYGGSTATMALVNNRVIDGSLTTVPWQLDVWLTPIATSTGSNTVYMTGTFSYSPANVGIVPSTASFTTFNADVIGTTALNTQNTLSVLGRWGNANGANQLAVRQRTLVIGN